MTSINQRELTMISNNQRELTMILNNLKEITIMLEFQFIEYCMYQVQNN